MAAVSAHRTFRDLDDLEFFESLLILPISLSLANRSERLSYWPRTSSMKRGPPEAEVVPVLALLLVLELLPVLGVDPLPPLPLPPLPLLPLPPLVSPLVPEVTEDRNPDDDMLREGRLRLEPPRVLAARDAADGMVDYNCVGFASRL